MNTIGEVGTDRCIELADTRSVTLLDAPVFGNEDFSATYWTSAPKETGRAA